MKQLQRILITSVLFLFIGCTSSEDLIKREYFTGGKVRSEFIMSDKTGQHGTLKKYGYDGKITSIATIKNGVKNGDEIWYDKHGRPIQRIPYLNGHIHGQRTVFYKNGDILATEPYVSGIKEGEAFTYNKDGSIAKSVLFSRGKIIN
jgi:antitoxin component YwqK of YwqJK toxin-antitoxin module